MTEQEAYRSGLQAGFAGEVEQPPDNLDKALQDQWWAGYEHGAGLRLLARFAEAKGLPKRD